jgi:hypothetical protein
VGLDAPDELAARYWTAWRATGDFTKSEAWAVVDDAVTGGDAKAVHALDAMWRQAVADDERRWVVDLLQEFLHLNPHRTPQLVANAAEHSESLRGVLALVDLESLPAKARLALGEG